MLLKFSPVAGRAKNNLCHWVGIASAKCRLKLKKHSVPWWLAFCFFVFFHCSPSGHGDSIRVYTRFASKKTIHHLKLGVIFGCFLVMLIPCVPAHEISPVFVFRLELGGGKNEITMARTAKKDKKHKFYVFWHLLRLSWHWWERSYPCYGGLKKCSFQNL